MVNTGSFNWPCYLTGGSIYICESMSMFPPEMKRRMDIKSSAEARTDFQRRVWESYQENLHLEAPKCIFWAFSPFSKTLPRADWREISPIQAMKPCVWFSDIIVHVMWEIFHVAIRFPVHWILCHDFCNVTGTHKLMTCPFAFASAWRSVTSNIE
jgi:hypothetical protein